MQKVIREKAKELLSQGTADRVLAWKTGEFFYDVEPHLFTSAEEIDRDLVWNGFCGANLSKYLIAESRKGGKAAVFLKPCDSFSFQQLLKEHRILRDAVYAVAIPCEGKLDMEKIRQAGGEGALSLTEADDTLTVTTLYGEKTLPRSEMLAERCLNCKSLRHVLYDEIIGEEGADRENDRFGMVEKLEKMTPEERFAFWQGELSRCIRCNACRNVCPACSCEKCVFDNPKSGVASKAPVTSFEEQNFHIIRAFHVAGRCTDCGECSRVCPQHIPLHLLNRKFIKDINTFYGPYQAGADPDTPAPLTDFRTDDREVREGGKRK